MIRTLCVYVSKELWIRVPFPKPKGVCEQENLGNTGLGHTSSDAGHNYV